MPLEARRLKKFVVHTLDCKQRQQGGEHQEISLRRETLIIHEKIAVKFSVDD